MSDFLKDKQLEPADRWMGPAKRSEPPIAERHREGGAPGQRPNHEPGHTASQASSLGHGHSLADIDADASANLGQTAPSANHFPGDADGCCENSFRGE